MSAKTLRQSNNKTKTTNNMSLQQAKKLAAAANLIQLPAAATPATPTGTPEQLANLQTVIQNAVEKVEEKKEKKTKEKVPTDFAINIFRENGSTQGRQPQKITAGEMPDFLADFYFASESARVMKSEAEMTAFVQEKIATGKVSEIAGDEWKYNKVPPTTMKGSAWKLAAPETVFYITKGIYIKAATAQYDNHFGASDEVENPLVG